MSRGRGAAGPQLQLEVVVAKVEARQTFRIGLQPNHDGLQPGSLTSFLSSAQTVQVMIKHKSFLWYLAQVFTDNTAFVKSLA